MANIILLILCLIIGIILRGGRILPASAATSLNVLIVYIVVPAVTILHTPDIQFSYAEALPIIAAWLVFGMAFLFFTALQKAMQFDRETVGALIVTAGISSISFVGFPIFEVLYGAEGLKQGILMSQSGTFIVCSTAGIATVILFVAEKNGEEAGIKNIKWLYLLRNIFFFPPFLAFLLALLLKFFGYQHPSVLKEILQKIGGTLPILALISIGLQIEKPQSIATLKPLLWGLFFKICLAPLIVFVLFFVILEQNNIAAKVSVLGSTLGSMNTIGIVAIQRGLKPQLVTQMIGLSIPISLIFLPLVYWFISLW